MRTTVARRALQRAGKLRARLLLGLLGAGLLPGLVGCVQLPDKSDPLRIIAPQVSVTPDLAWPEVDWSLIVQRPVADQTRGSARVVVRTPYSRLSFYPGVVWLDELPELLQTEVLRAFIDSQRITAVSRPGIAKARYGLAIEIRRFDAVEESRRQLTVELELQAALLEVRSGQLLASNVFSERVPMEGNDADGLTAAFEEALGLVIGRMIGWTLSAAPQQTGTTAEAPGR